MNDLTPDQMVIAHLMTDLEDFCAFNMQVKPKVGRNVPFIWNRAQRYIHAKLEEQRQEMGFVRALILKGRQQGCCLAPDTKVLTADLRWVEIANLAIGQQLVATDENTGDGVRGRKMRTATVEALVRTRQPSYRVTLDDGRQVVTSGLHRWLVRKSQTQWDWRSIDGMGPKGFKVGDKLRSIAEPWAEGDLGDAWFGGLIDGEGSMDIGGTGASLAISQCEGAVLQRMKDHCAARGYGHYIVSDDGPRKTKFGQRPVHAVTLSNMTKMFQVMGQSRPVRFIDRQWWVGKSMPDNGERVVVAIEPLGEIDVVDIQTSTGTFIAEGLVTHNSTYVGARFYHKTSMNRSTNAFIVAHEDKATSNLFSMVKRYHSFNPMAPTTRYSNGMELVFNNADGTGLDSGYKLATAGTEDVGRSNTAQLLHGSEFGFWKNAQSHLAGLGNTIADESGTEIILESTGNGLGNAFHQMWQEAEAGRGLFIAIFVPWYWQDEYRAQVRPDFELSDADEKYMRAFGLDMAQMQWRANKISTYGHGYEWLFDQEYPATPALAFQSSTMNPLIKPTDVQMAVASRIKPDPSAPLVIGCDPAEEGYDRTSIVFRQGRVVLKVEYHPETTPMQVAGMLAKYHMDGIKVGGIVFKPDAMFIDKIGIGAGIYDRLVELHIPCIGVNSANRARDPERFENRRAEMWWDMRDWVIDEPCRIPNDPALVADLSAPEPRLHSSGRRLLESKKDMKKRGMRSPDGGDALALTFYEPVERRSVIEGAGKSHAGPATSAGY